MEIKFKEVIVNKKETFYSQREFQREYTTNMIFQLMIIIYRYFDLRGDIFSMDNIFRDDKALLLFSYVQSGDSSIVLSVIRMHGEERIVHLSWPTKKVSR